MKPSFNSKFLVITTLLALAAPTLSQAAPATAQQREAKKLYNSALRLSMARNRNRTCAVTPYAFKHTIASRLSNAITLDDRYREMFKANRIFAKALAGSLSYALLAGQLNTPGGMASALEHAYFETDDSDAYGPTHKLQFAPGNQVTVIHLDLMTDENEALHPETQGTYELDTSGAQPRITIKAGSMTFIGELSLGEDGVSYELKAMKNGTDEYTFFNNPLECEA